MSISTISDAVKYCVMEMVRSVDSDWKKILIYSEFFLENPGNEASVVNSYLSAYWDKFNAKRDFSPSYEVDEALQKIFLMSRDSLGGQITGVRIEVSSEGKFKSNYFFEGKPLQEGDYNGSNARFYGED